MKQVRLDVLVKSNGRWYVYSEDRTKRLGGPYDTRAEAVKRLRQIEYFKQRKDQSDPDSKRKAVAREVAIQRVFSQKKPKRPRRGLPALRFPKRLVVEYRSALRRLMLQVAEAYRPLLVAIRQATVRVDADFSKKVKEEARKKTPKGGEFSKQLRLQGRDAKRLLDEAERRLEATVSTAQVQSLASQFARRTSNYQKLELSRQIRSAIGVDPFLRDSVLAGATEDFVAQNVSLIKRIPKRLHEKIEGLVMNSVGRSELNINLGKEIAKNFNVEESRAAFIARDQLAKYYGAVNRARQQEMGMTRFIWRTVNDERVRDSHADLEGETFEWDDLPVNERGERIFPGSDFQCRCTSEPVLDDLLDDLEDAEEELRPPTFGIPEFDDDPEHDE